MAKHRTEQVYDDEIAPLVSQIVAICKREEIPILISAGMFNEEGVPMTCDSKLRHGIASKVQLPGVDNRYSLAFEIIRGHAGFDTASGLAITRHHPSVAHDPGDNVD